jgi:hypothetical protein
VDNGSADFKMDLDEVERLASGQVGQPLPARFYIEPRENLVKSKEAGRPVFEDVEMIEIRIDQTDVRTRQVEEKDIRMYPALYLALRRGQSQEAVEGMPLREWAGCKRGEAETLAMQGIRTVEHLAGASDQKLQTLGPLLGLRQKARDWLEQAAKGAGVAKLRSENDELRARLTALEKMLETQAGEIALARGNGGNLPAVVPDTRITALEAKLEALLAVKAPVEEAPKRRGRKPGSKNKPKIEAPGEPKE